jgi:transcriptional regulator with XRE-family HTH domain
MSLIPLLFGEKLQFLRNRRGWTQGAMGTLLNCSQAYISKLESGNKPPTVELVLRIADLFDVSVDYLLRDSIAVARADDTPKKMLRRVRRGRGRTRANL